MTNRINKDEFARRLAARMDTDEATATAWVDGAIETLYQSFKAGHEPRHSMPRLEARLALFQA